jgi:hypothetical protein
VSRYLITFDGLHNADDDELFPDGEQSRTTLENLLDRVPLKTFLHDWLYAEDLRVMVSDSLAGEVVEWNGHRWSVLKAAKAAEVTA